MDVITFLQAVLMKMKDPNLLGNEKMRLEEILELCADYERQIEEEQRDLLEQRVRRQLAPLPTNMDANGGEPRAMQSPKLVLSSSRRLQQQQQQQQQSEQERTQQQRHLLSLSFPQSSLGFQSENNNFAASPPGSIPPTSPGLLLTPNR